MNFRVQMHNEGQILTKVCKILNSLPTLYASLILTRLGSCFFCKDSVRP